ncbi:uncharacterized protein VICG_01559 [Vittaforma corneae ATCC 50505]|uniref:N-acetyltransferase domain-containing protein n=1 Tax=Vittaforma corneae (strain ATCC 50505) TaxID=993615 RepID=L2GLD3_VITCO|nr:uncharacterized protein VICG_01559 [Vittaforma corneae ATCC 50505]ELA41454.1 hypothetical protein VICG_01559 [Vittaforma corneae ATCC 50505]
MRWEPIRYSIGDEVEDWLYKTLLLGPKISQVEQCPLLSQCSLYYVNKDVLFNGSQKSETFLSEIFSLFVASHYRNSPNDIQTLSDSPSHEIFVLMAPFKPLRIVCAIQVSFEGKCNKNACVKQGNLIPWVIYENFFDDQFLDKLGMRIVRVAVHPSMLSMGYGSLALLTLTNLFIDRHESHSSKSEHNAYTTGEQCSKNSISVDYNPSCIMCDDQSTLFHPINTIKTPNIDWIGSSFGVSERLLNFWKRSNFNPVCIKQTQSKTTGEFSIVLLKAIGNKTDEFDGMKTLFLERFVPLLSYSFKNLSPTLALSLIYSSNAKVLDKKIHFSKDEVNRLTKFSNGLIDIKSIMDILPDLSRSYFYQNDLNKLSVVSQIALLMIGCQRKTVKEVAEYLSLDCFKVINLIISTIGTLLSTDLK